MPKEYVEFESENRRDRIVLGEPPLPEPIPEFPNFGHIELKGVLNCRDLGGMPAASGRVIASGRLLRSDALQHLHKDDAATLIAEHELCHIVDFRTDLEREGRGDRMELLPEVTSEHLPVFREEEVGITQGSSPLEELEAARTMMDSPFERVRGLYKVALLGEAGVSAYRQFLSGLLNRTEGATLWHCSEGKDRAGLAAFIVEAALGVPESYRRADYLATNLFVRSGFDRFFDNIARAGVAQLFAKEIDAFFYAFEAYLDAGLSAVDAQYGSFDAYLTDALDFGPGKQQLLRDRYLV